MVIFYLGPNTVMPLVSILAAVVGAILIFWRYIAGIIRRVFTFLIRRQKAPVESTSDSESKALD